MSNEELQDTLYTLPQSYVEEMLDDIETHTEIALSHIKSALTDDKEMKCYISQLIEYANYNQAIKRILVREIRDPQMFFNEQTGKEEYVITKSNLLALQALVLGKLASRTDLNTFGISMLLN